MNQKGKFILFSREEFKDWLFSSIFKREIRFIQNHHTWIPNYSHFKGDNHFALLEAMERSHTQRGLGGIAQNLTTFSDGQIAVCRPFDQMPAGIANKNLGAICIENLGDFDLNKDVMTEEHKRTILFVNAILCKKFGLGPSTETIVYHHWFAPKSCPGTNFFGGNSIESAKQSFIPLVLKELNKLNKIKLKVIG